MRFVGSRSCAFYTAISLAFVGPLNAPSAAKERSPEQAATSSAAAVKSLSAEPSSAEQLVQQALAAEAAGNSSQRVALLKEALAADPDYAPAHWHLGHVRVRDRWLSTTEAAQAAARSGKIAQYRNRRSALQANAASHLKMANWCAGADLKEQERFHLLFAAQFKLSGAQRHEIARRLRLVCRRGIWLSEEQVEEQKQVEKESDAALREWKPRLASLRFDLESNNTSLKEAAREQLSHISDPGAVLAIEDAFRKDKAEIGGPAVAALAGMRGQVATDALLRFAVFAPDEDVRQQAAEQLRGRPLFSFAPSLILTLEAPTEVHFQWGYENGLFRHSLKMFREGPTADQSVSVAGGEHDEVVYSRVKRQVLFEVTNPDQTLTSDFQWAAHEIAANKEREKLNERVTAALAAATGNDFGKDPQPWWQWWIEFNEMYQQEKPVIQSTRNFTPIRVHYVSCFVAGTPVWTSTGPLAIEELQPGDCVLAQDPDTGELKYKAVLGTTVRPPSPLVLIQAGGDTIRATRGHPFWVAGLGWQMAKELKAGQNLHTTAGPVAIDSAAQNGEQAECYNLVVADFNTYFVGNQQILVHDNMLREVTAATVPGLVDP